MNTDILLDTHVFIWLMNGDSSLSVSTQDIITQCSKNNVLYISAITIWEIGMLHNKKKLSLSQPITQWLEKAKSLSFIKIASVNDQIALESCQLPGDFHGDPADRMIVATARLYNIPLFTRDKKIVDYAQHCHLKVIPC